jgi:hypothetical protein
LVQAFLKKWWVEQVNFNEMTMMSADFVCLYNYEFWLSLCKIVRSSVILLLPLFVLDQHAKLDIYSASTLKQQSMVRNVAPLGHIILTPSQPVFALNYQCCVLNWETANTNLIVFGLISDRDSKPLEAST